MAENSKMYIKITLIYFVHLHIYIEAKKWMRVASDCCLLIGIFYSIKDLMI